jgi:hypothetical protein
VVSKVFTIEPETFNEIGASRENFDLSAPLTEQELEYAGMVTGKATRSKDTTETPILKDLEDLEPEQPTDAVAVFMDGKSYNTQYVRYLKCQALASLVAFEEGWKAFEEIVLKAYLVRKKLENDNYRGDDPNKAFSLRLRKQEAEDFIKYMRAVIAEAVNTPKPVLGKK